MILTQTDMLYSYKCILCGFETYFQRKPIRPFRKSCNMFLEQTYGKIHIIYMCIYMCVCVYMYICVCVYVYMCVCICIYVCVYMYICVCVYIYVYM